MRGSSLKLERLRVERGCAGEEEVSQSCCASAKKKQNITRSALHRNNNVNFKVGTQGSHFPTHQEATGVAGVLEM